MARDDLLFCTEDLSARLDGEPCKIQGVITRESDDYILSVNEVAYIASIESRFTIEELQFFAEKAYVAWEGDRRRFLVPDPFHSATPTNGQRSEDRNAKHCLAGG